MLCSDWNFNAGHLKLIMKTLYYLSPISFYQTDMGILHSLSKTYSIIYGVTIPCEGNNSIERDILNYCKRYNIKFSAFHFTKRQRDIRIGLDFIRVLRNIKSSNPDIIYTYCLDNPILSLLGLTLNRRKTIVFIHDVEFHSSIPFSNFLTIGRSITTSRFKNFQVFSNNQAILFRKLYPNKNVRSIPLPLADFGHPIDDKSTSRFDKMKTKFLFFGNIVPYKGLELLINAVNALNLKYSNFELTIAGRCDNWQAEYEPLIKNKKIINSLIRHIPSGEIADLFSDCHYLVLPYKDATQSGPLMIAYNYNLPVIASDIPAFQEAVKDRTTGYLFNKNIPNSLESAMEYAILQTREEYGLLLKKLKHYVESHFSKERITSDYQIMFSEFDQNHF